MLWYGNTYKQKDTRLLDILYTIKYLIRGLGVQVPPGVPMSFLNSENNILVHRLFIFNIAWRDVHG